MKLLFLAMVAAVMVGSGHHYPSMYVTIAFYQDKRSMHWYRLHGRAPLHHSHGARNLHVQ